MIRGAVYRIDLGEVKRGHEQRGQRYGVVLSPTSKRMTTATVVPTSTSAQPSIARPEIEVAGRMTRFLVDQIRTIDTDYVLGEPIDFLDWPEMAQIEQAVVEYLGLDVRS